jgi:hypothetical protein
MWKFLGALFAIWVVVYWVFGGPKVDQNPKMDGKVKVTYILDKFNVEKNQLEGALSFSQEIFPHGEVTFPEVGDYQVRVYNRKFENSSDQAGAKPVFEGTVSVSSDAFTNKDNVLSTRFAFPRSKIKDLNEMTVDFQPPNEKYPKVEFSNNIVIGGAGTELSTYLSQSTPKQESSASTTKKRSGVVQATGSGAIDTGSGEDVTSSLQRNDPYSQGRKFMKEWLDAGGSLQGGFNRITAQYAGDPSGLGLATKGALDYSNGQ